LHQKARLTIEHNLCTVSEVLEKMTKILEAIWLSSKKC
jgi:hypothetical protein